jgi:hypothetical protein
MVNNSGQLYTIEGIAAGILMLTTAYLVLSTTSIYTPAETHISDMQLGQLGNDVLLIMDTPEMSVVGLPPGVENNALASFIENNQKKQFSDRFNKLLTTNGTENIKFTSMIYFRNSSGIQSYDFTDPISKPIVTNRERMVKVSRLVQINPPFENYSPNILDPRNQTVLLEVYLWRD